MYAFHPQKTQPLLIVENGLPRTDPHEIMLAVSDGWYSSVTDLAVLAGMCVVLFLAVGVAVRITKR